MDDTSSHAVSGRRQRFLRVSYRHACIKPLDYARVWNYMLLYYCLDYSSAGVNVRSPDIDYRNSLRLLGLGHVLVCSTSLAASTCRKPC
jgi:hypothetical protein